MYGNNRKDIDHRLENSIDYSYISLMSYKIRIGVVGGGKAGMIKVKHFVKNKCSVEVLSKEFNDDVIKMLKDFKDNLKLINKEFDFEFLKDKHIVIIASNDEDLNQIIRNYCDENSKIYIDSTDFTKGMGVVPVERSTKNMNIALNTKNGNPKGAVLMCNKAKDYLSEYDDYIELTTKIRNNIKSYDEYKKDVLDFIYSSEFENAYMNGTYKEALEAKFNKELVEKMIN